MNDYKNQALAEYNSEESLIRQGGKNGRGFWNINSSQFMFVPSFMFPAIPSAEVYKFTAVDCTGATYTFEATEPIAPLTPIWKDIAPGMVELKVEAIHKLTKESYLAGVRTFFKSAPFPGRENLPPKALSYRECALKAFKYVFEDEANQYWLKNALPDPEYYHNVYPSKMISSIVKAMISYAKLDPEKADDAIRLAVNAADYLLSITYDETSALCGLPPTYSFKGLNKENVDKNAPAAYGRRDTLMMLYPANVGSMYLSLEKVTGDTKYFEAAKEIADYYKNNILPNGSWYLLVSAIDGTPVSDNCCIAFEIIEFLNAFYERTKDVSYKNIADTHYSYIMNTRFVNYNWEAQFEDTRLSGNYLNLTHLLADKMICHISANLSDDENMVKEAEELMRFVEDQFIVWKDFAPWSNHYNPEESFWYAPAVLEQYFWYVPIDGSTGMVIKALLELYKVNHNPLLLEKACALGDAITRMQNPESGVIPTHWMKKDCAYNLENFWINCHIGAAFNMMYLAEVTENIEQ